MNKKELFYKYTDFTTLQNIGGYWVEQAKQYMPIAQWITESAMYKIFLSQWNVPVVAIFLIVVLKYYFWIIGRWVIAQIAIKIGVYAASQQYNAKKEHLNPFQVETIKQLEAIGTRLGIESQFTKL